jgi:hypothetical protein
MTAALATSLDNKPSSRDRRLSAAVQPMSDLTTSDIRAMFDLYASYYDGTSRDLFESDVSEKDYAVILREASGDLAGFSTLAVLDIELGDENAKAIYSGDTIIDQPYWGTQALAFSWLRFAGGIKAQAPDRRLFWFLIVKGHRTYRYLSAFSVDFFPHWNADTPRAAQTIMDSLAQRRFGENYNARRGVVSFAQSRGHLKESWAKIPPEERARPDVAFFLARNPGYVRGDELVCLTELSAENLRPLARRVFQQGLSA